MKEFNKTINTPKVVLVAEDDDISFSYLEILLLKEECEVFRTVDGKSTVEMVKNNPNIDLLLMDLKMPVMNGVTATFLIRKFNKTIPIIAQTAYAFESDRIEALNAGCNDYIIKPIRKIEFLNKLHQYLNNSTVEK